jgi:tryptophan synthase alpha chain
MSRLQETFARLKATGRPGLVTYVTAGDPDAAASAQILIALARAGADVIEVGVPFSDPVADGPVIQRASERALAGGMTLRGSLDLVRRIRMAIDTPIVLFTYANPVVRMDPASFARAAARAGVDGVLILDYPVEEAEPLRAPIIDAGLDPIFLLSPTTTGSRIEKANTLGRGFLYLISRLGVTGARDEMSADMEELVSRVRRHSTLPIALGFGISKPVHVQQACRVADAAVVGSALVNMIAEHGRSGDIAQRVTDYVRWLRSGASRGAGGPDDSSGSLEATA